MCVRVYTRERHRHCPCPTPYFIFSGTICGAHDAVAISTDVCVCERDTETVFVCSLLVPACVCIQDCFSYIIFNQ